MRLPPVGLVLFCATTAAAQPALPEWKLGPSPEIAIGGDGSPRTEFLNIGNVWRLSDGNIVVINRATHELRIFSPRGAFLRSFGRKGQGPGEFEGIFGTGRSGDTAFVYDGMLQRISKVLLRGTPRLIGEQPFAIEAPPGESYAVGRLPNGQWLVRGLAMPEPPSKTGRYRIPGYVGIANATTTGPVKWQPRMPDGDAFAWTPPGNPNALSLVATAFSAELQNAVAGSVVWFGDGSSDSLIRLDPATNARKTIRLAPGAVVTKAMIDAGLARDLELARNDRDRERARLRYSAELLPKRLPSYEALIGAPGGDLWIQRGAPSATAPAEYIVLSTTGAPIARVNAPAGFRVKEIGSDYVTGVHKDDDGVETVRIYSLRRR